MEKTRKKSHPLLTIPLILLALILLAAVSPFLYDLIGGFEDYDDIPALIAAGGAGRLSVEDSGVVSISFSKADIYACASRMQAEKQLLAYIRQLPFCSEKTVNIDKFGYTLRDEELSASVRVKLFGFIPVQLHADGKLELTAEEIRLRLYGLQYGKWIPIPLEKCAAYFGVPELTDGFVIDISDFWGNLHPLDLSAKDSLLLFRCDILNQAEKSVGESGTLLATLTPILCNTDSDAARILRGDASDVYGKIEDPGALSGLLTELLRFGSEADAEKIRLSLEDSLFPDLEIGDVSVCSSGYASELSEALHGYETGLETLRDNYKTLQYSLARDGLYCADGTPAESALPEAWGARIVLQYNLDYDSIVKANDGSFDPGGGWTVLPNPKITDLKRDSYRSLPNIPGITVFDLTLAIRTADGTPAILFLTALDELGINVIPEALYEEILSSETLPVYCASDIISARAYSFVTPDAAQRDLHFYLP